MYTEIFKELLTITHHDYAGYLDKKGWDRPDHYLRTIKLLERDDKLEDESFSQLVNEYLLDFNNQFRKLLTLKNLLSYDAVSKKIPLAMEINGEVIGVNTMKLVDDDIDLMGFSIPINVVKEFLKKIK